MKPRKAAGWGVLSLLPLGYFSAAILADQLTEALVALGITGGIALVAIIGMSLVMGDD